MINRLKFPYWSFLAVTCWGTLFISSGQDNLAAAKIGTNFWFCAQWAETPFNSQITNSNDGSSYIIPNGLENPWSNTYLTDIHIYSTFRFMDWNGTNYSTQKEWTKRTLKYTSPFSGYKGPNAIAYEWMIDLCNRVGADMWINIPHLAIDPADFPTGVEFNNEYVHKLAILIKHGIDMKGINLHTLTGNDLTKLGAMTAEQLIGAGGVRTHYPLESQLKVYIEYSNETWLWKGAPEGWGGQSDWANTNSTKLGLWNGGYGGGQGFATYAIIRCGKAFYDVFGDQKSRIKIILAGTPSDYSTTWAQEMMKIVNNAAYNPWKIPMDYKTYAVYIASNSNCQTFTDNTNAMYIANPQTISKPVQNFLYFKTTYNMGIVNYEFGEESGDGSSITNQDCAYQAYTNMLQKQLPYTSLFMHYTHGGGQWGAMPKPGQTDLPKYRALKDWVYAHGGPRKTPAQVLGYKPPVAILTSSTDKIANNPFTIAPTASHGIVISFTQQQSPVKVRLQTLNGSQIYTKTLTNNASMIEIPARYCAKGIVILSIQSGTINKTVTLTRQ